MGCSSQRRKQCCEFGCYQASRCQDTASYSYANVIKDKSRTSMHFPVNIFGLYLL